jgi:RNA-binding protein YhbY
MVLILENDILKNVKDEINAHAVIKIILFTRGECKKS